jgi:hypothetical protein
MYAGKTLFAQLMDFVPWTTFAKIVARYGGDHRVPHESPHFEATRKSLIFGFPRRLDGESADWGSDASTEGAI